MHDLTRPMTDAEFNLLRGLIYEKAGIFLPEIKKPLLSGRLNKRLRQLQLDTFKAYHHLVCNDVSGEEMAYMLDAITTNETQFFREPRHFEFLRDQVYPEWRRQVEQGTRKRKVRVWSAACSSGEEPYSIAMSLLADLCQGDRWDIHILASDISNNVLQQARSATWPIPRADEIPPPLLKRFMLKGTGSKEGLLRAGPELRALVEAQYINLHETTYPVQGGFDMIFCRNVLIYFDKASRSQVIYRLLDLLAPDGYLFLGHAESLTGLEPRVKPVAASVYRLA